MRLAGEEARVTFPEARDIGRLSSSTGIVLSSRHDS